jgi:hypothetical protein
VHEIEIEAGERQTRRRGLHARSRANGHGLLGQRGFFDLFSFVKFERPKGIIELGAPLPLSTSQM